MLKKILLFACVLTFIHGYGQTDQLAYRVGLYRSLTTARTDTARITLLQKIGNDYLASFIATRHHAYTDSAVSIFKRSLVLSEAPRLNDISSKYEGLLLIGTAYVMGGDSVTARPYIMQYINYYVARKQPARVLRGWMKYGEGANAAPFLALSLQCYRQALSIAAENKLFDKETDINYNISRRLFELGKPDEGISNTLETIKKFSRQKVNLDKQYLAMAHYYRYKGEIKRSLQYCLWSVDDMEQYKDTVNAHLYYGEIAQIYEVLGQTEKSIDYYKRTVELREKIVNMPEEYILRTAGFIVKGLIKIGRFNEALAEAKAVEGRNPPKTITGKAIIAQNRAYGYQALKNYPMAEKYYVEMINNFDNSGRRDEIVMLACYDIGSFYAAIKQYKKAQIYTRRLGDPLMSFDIQKNVELLRFRVDSGLGNYRQALDYYIRYQKLKDSIVDEATSKQIAELQIKYETSQKENDIKQLRTDGQRQRDHIKQANMVRNITFIGVGLLSIALVLLYISYRGNQKKSREIDLKNASLNKLLTEKDDLLEEKEWLMKEVHHRVKNNLQIVMGLLQRQSAYINNKEALAAIQNSEHRMHSVALIHQKLYQSDSFMLVNMVDYINEMTGYLRDSFDMGEHISFDKQVADINFEVNIAVPLGLILNEAITNAIKYAFPTYEYGVIHIVLESAGDDSYLLEINDNGRGLPAGLDTKKNNTMGFNLMRGLSKQLNGTLSMVNEGGVSIKVLFRPDQHDL